MPVALRFFIQFPFGSSPEKIRSSSLVAMSRIHTGGQALHMIRRHLKMKIHDDDTWKEFQNPNGPPFLSLCDNFAFQMNVDWFNPLIDT